MNLSYAELSANRMAKADQPGWIAAKQSIETTRKRLGPEPRKPEQPALFDT